MIKKNYNENYFEKIDTEDKAYFLGLIFADGCIMYQPIKFRYSVVITLHPKDVHILESFIKFIDGEMTVWKNKNREICQVSLSGKKIVNDLIKLGAVPNKTFKLNYPQINVKLEKHFLRGYFDGDGCIRIRTDHRDNTQLGDLRIVSGSVDMLNMINKRMYNLFETKINKLYGPKNKTYKFIGWASMSDIERIYEGFYGNTNNELFLIRKKVIFDEVIKIIENKKKYRKK